MIYFDNAATTGKKPPSVISAVNTALAKFSANPGRSGHKISIAAAEQLYKARIKVADFFGTPNSENVIFTANCTESLNFVIKGVLKQGDTALVSDLEHNAVMRPLTALGVNFDTFETSLSDDEITLENFKKKLISKKPKMVVSTAASNVLGKKEPIEEMGKLCRKYGVLFCVDAAQTAGIEEINMEKMCIDFLCVAAHKGLYAPMGIGILIANAPIEKTIIEGGTGTDSINFLQPDILPEKFESGTVNLPAIMGVSAGVDFIKNVGRERIKRQENLVLKQIYRGLKQNKKAILYIPFFDEKLYVPVLSFNIFGKNSLETAKFLNGKGIAVRAGLHCAPTAHKKIGTEQIGTVRISPSVYNNFYEADYLLKTLKKL